MKMDLPSATVASQHGKKRHRDTMFCDHCHRDVSKSTFYRHYQEFFDPVAKRWRREGVTGTAPAVCLPRSTLPLEEETMHSEANNQVVVSEDEGVNVIADHDEDDRLSLSDSSDSDVSIDLGLEELWLSSESESEETSSIETQNVSRPVWQLAFFILIWQSLYRISNTATNALLKFIYAFFNLVIIMVTSNEHDLQDLMSKFPQNIRAAQQLLWQERKTDIIEFVVCPKCHSVYSYEDCVITRAGQKESKVCSHVAYPDHPQLRRRKACGTVLLKRIKVKSGYKLIPIKCYPYQPLSHSFTYLVNKEGFLQSCEKWRHRLALIPSTHLSDIYGGRVWRDFGGFLDAPNSFLLTLNIDWFQHRQQCRDVLKATTKSAMRKAESAVGLRYTCLLDLIYFDPVRFTIVDVMHNLFLGTGKHILKLWLSLELLSKLDLAKIESRIGNFSVPGSVGRLPSNISSNHGGFTANQWQSWIVLYSPVVLKGILDKQHYNCWLLFVRACSPLCGRIITYTEIDTADLLLLNFCKKVEQLYGRENCTPNLHLHLHLKQCLLDYGPSHAFWLYSFERYNGLLGSYHTNKKSIEIQIMRKFVDNQRLTGLNI